ncbi:cytochrome c [Roseateles violae]|uniref:C-type cytochrome n=1 Tax=Roseateles violae TaxID=3058042 RepID=A0ABT8DX69_9BURK|nr:c-type cytochrome [Pelomonas sp. PFR6]MDN3921194.1 c-type cytochrome [Pelomonas sp. PFR6]
MSGRRTALRIALLLAALALGLAALVWRLNHLDEAPASTEGTAPPTPALLERGAYLARVGNCAGCHTARGGPPYAGGRAIATPFGAVFAPNLTPDAATGLGGWSRADFWAALHNGRGRDGRLLSPAFPYPNYALLSRADADALFAYLQSLTPVAQPNLPSQLRFPYNTQLSLAVWRALYFRPAVFEPDARRGAEWNRGAYLSQGLAHCSACHATRNGLGAGGTADFSGGLLAGSGWLAPSLHDPAEAGVMDWSPAALRQWLAHGSNAALASAQGPMAEVILGSTRHLNEADLAAMAQYLQALPRRPVERPEPAEPQPLLRELGRRLYGEHCAACHGQQGEGVAGAYPPLAGSRVVTMASPGNLLLIIQRGGFAPATAGHPRPFGMPPFAGVLDDRQLAALASYLRNSWGHQAGDVRLLDVVQLKSRRID